MLQNLVRALNSVNAVGLRRRDKERGTRKGSWLPGDESRSRVCISPCHVKEVQFLGSPPKSTVGVQKK